MLLERSLRKIFGYCIGIGPGSVEFWLVLSKGLGIHSHVPLSNGVWVVGVVVDLLGDVPAAFVRVDVTCGYMRHYFQIRTCLRERQESPGAVVVDLETLVHLQEEVD